MRPQSAKEKGRRAERKLKGMLALKNISSHRVAGSGSGQEKGDVDSVMPILFEVKNEKSFHIWQAIRQATRAAEKVHKIPAVAFCERNDEPAWCIVPTDWVLDIWLKSKEPKNINTQDRELSYWLGRAKEATTKVLRLLENG